MNEMNRSLVHLHGVVWSHLLQFNAFLVPIVYVRPIGGKLLHCRQFRAILPIGIGGVVELIWPLGLTYPTFQIGKNGGWVVYVEGGGVEGGFFRT